MPIQQKTIKGSKGRKEEEGSNATRRNDALNSRRAKMPKKDIQYV
jgi:hypothetical protein